jgi:phosphoenolpyruvate-protein kinase (PTS system EI component)
MNLRASMVGPAATRTQAVVGAVVAFALALLVGLGLRQLSLSPNNLPAVKAVIRRLDTGDAERIAAEALTLESARDVVNYLLRERKRIHPEAAGGGEE